MLLEAKELCGHGNFCSWLEDNFDGSERIAQVYMRLYSKRAVLEAKAQRVADLTVRGAVALLQEKKPDPPEWNALIPPKGAATLATSPNGDYVAIHLSTHPGFYYVNHYRWGAHGEGGLQEGTNKPIRQDSIGLMLDHSGFDWRDAEIVVMADDDGPHSYNHWFYPSEDEYIRQCEPWLWRQRRKQSA